MNFYIKNYPKKDEIIEGIEDGSFLPKSESLLLSYFLHNENSQSNYNHIHKLLKSYDEFLPINVFSGYMSDSSFEIHRKIFNYKSTKDGTLAELFNKIVMLFFYNQFYIGKDKWDSYFDGYRNESISEDKKHSLLESTINDICDLLGLNHIKVLAYTYYIDNMTKNYYDKIIYNPALRKIYIEGTLGSRWINDNIKAREIVFLTIARCMLDTSNGNTKYIKLLGITNERMSSYKNSNQIFNDDINQIALALEYYYKIYTGETTV